VVRATSVQQKLAKLNDEEAFRSAAIRNNFRREVMNPWRRIT